MSARSAVRFPLAHLAVVYPYAVLVTALGYLSHPVLDSLTGPIPWGWPFAHWRVALAPAALRIRTASSIETWLVRPVITIAAVLAILERSLESLRIRGDAINPVDGGALGET